MSYKGYRVASADVGVRAIAAEAGSHAAVGGGGLLVRGGLPDGILDALENQGFRSPLLQSAREGREMVTAWKYGQPYTVATADLWFSRAGDHSLRDMEVAMAALARLIGWPGGSVIGPTPAKTGVDFALRLFPGLRPQPVEVQKFVRRHSGQSRVECCALPGTVPSIYAYDLELAYLRGASNAFWSDGWVLETPGRACRTGDGYLGVPGLLPPWVPGLYFARVTAPSGWSHVGILTSDRMEWPASGTFHSYATAREVAVALRSGWNVEIIERCAPAPGRPESRPLRPWAEALLGLIGAHIGSPEGAAVRDVCRSVANHSIGRMFAGRYRRTVTCQDLRSVPDDGVSMETLRPCGEGWAYETEADEGGGLGCHPELAATIYGDTRTWLLSRLLPTCRQGSSGALHVRRDSVIGFATDCVYLSRPSDVFALDDRWRLKVIKHGPFPAPENMADIYRLTRDG